jgi:hypothetical protein
VEKGGSGEGEKGWRGEGKKGRKVKKGNDKGEEGE